jgi:hypothetical protein
MIITKPRTSRNTASTRRIRDIFSFGLTRISKDHDSGSGWLFVKINKMLFGIIGVQTLILRVPFVGIATV